MRVPVKLLGFVFWLFFFNCGQCRGCIREDIKYENTEPVAKASYSDGETVKVNCMTGFTGMYRLKCEKGTWNIIIERPCAKKKCSHPGDTPNGDFKLIAGSEFVFGATVLYTCKKGFEMTSRINQRTCRAQGWDNTVPVCEAVKCPAIHTNAAVTASGNTEEGSYGDVIHFECVSSDKKIDGSSDIHCKETGEWSDSVPTCKEITCTAPDISNGLADEPRQVYQRDAILKYRCLPGFKPRDGIPRCAKFGWTLNPECDEVTCELKSTRFGVNKINPAGKTIFRAGESVEITCAKRYWIFGTKETIKTFTCKENGEWDHEPVCEDIRCEVPRDQHVNYPEYYFRGDMKVGAKKTYYCMSGYVQKVATCTEDGWTPKPLCAEKTCAAPNIPNAQILGDQKPNYKIYSKIQYKCRRGFEPEQAVEITCNSQTEWTGIRQCTEKEKLCPDLSVENWFMHTHSSNEDEIFYSCNTGYKPFSGSWWDSVTCSKGSWSEEPWCIPENECGAFPSVHHGKLKQTKQIFRDGDTTALECDPGFKPTQRLIKCVSGTWETPVCEVDVRCGFPPKVGNAFITSKPEKFYGDGSSVTYACGSSSSMIGKSTVSCRSGTWEETPICKEVMCVANLTEGMRSDVTADRRTGLVSVRSGHTITLSCIGRGMKLQGRGKINCLSDGQWDVPFPKCGEKCPLNTTVEGLIMKRFPDVEGPIKPEHKLIFSCNREGLKLKGEREITCQPSGEWSSPFPECEAEATGEATCPLNATVEDLIMKRFPDIEGPVKPGHKLIFSCNKEGLKLKGESEITCQPNGEWNSSFPECEAETTGEEMCPLSAAVGGLIMKRIPDEGPVKHGLKLIFSCDKGLNIKGEREITCLPSGKWSSSFPECEVESTGGQSAKNEKKLEKNTEFSV